jgi:predicted ATP-dependent endonuclease of OLD family
MAHIVSFTIENLVGRHDTYSQTLNRDVNIFFGLNGTGKTSILKILDSALSNDTRKLANVPFTEAEVVIYSMTYNQAFAYRIKQQKPSVSADVPEFQVIDHHGILKPFQWVPNPKPPSFEGGWSHIFLPTSRLFQFLAQIDPANRPRGTFYDETADIGFEQLFTRYWAQLVSTIQREISKAQHTALVDILDKVLSIRPSSNVPQGFLDWETAYTLMGTFLSREDHQVAPQSQEEFKIRFQSDALLREVIQRINECERAIDLDSRPRNNLQSILATMIGGPKQLQFTDTAINIRTEDNLNIGVRSLSSGEKHLLFILLLSIQAEVSSFLIDEPEISMHVDWQKELITSMQSLNPRSQIIVATHSPDIMAKIDESKIFRV